jgi:hypothetical protein
MPWGSSGSGSLSVGLLDLLRCTTRYYFIESWLAGRPDGWVLGLPVVEYLANTPDLRWQRRNANVARWLSEMAGVGLSCYIMELCGAANICVSNDGRSGPDYRCRLTIAGKDTETWFESKGSSTRAGVTAQVQRAAKQVTRYKHAGANTLGLVCAACVPLITSNDEPCIHLIDPPPEEELDIAPFQYEIASLASMLGWAGELDVAHEVASAVMSFEDEGPTFLPPEQAMYGLQERLPRLVRALAGAAERGVQHTILSYDEGATVNVSLPADNIRDLWLRCRDGAQSVAEFQVQAVRHADIERGDYASVAPDGSAMVWRLGGKANKEQ